MGETDRQFVMLRRLRGPGGNVAFGAAFCVYCAVFALLFLGLGIFAAAYWWPLGLCPFTGTVMLGLMTMWLSYGVVIGARDVMTAPTVTVAANRERIPVGGAFTVRWRTGEGYEKVNRMSLNLDCVRERRELPPPDQVGMVYHADIATITEPEVLRAGEAVINIPSGLPATGSSGADGTDSWSVSVTMELRRGWQEVSTCYEVVVVPGNIGLEGGASGANEVGTEPKRSPPASSTGQQSTESD